MANDVGILFIDANQYLELYRTVTGKKLLAPLREQRGHIFVTAQIVEEVQRRKVDVASSFFARQFERLQLRIFDVPDHLFGRTDDRVRPIRDQLREIHDKIEAANNQLKEIAHYLLGQISRSQDEVSNALAEIFQSAAAPTEDERQRAGAEGTGQPAR